MFGRKNENTKPRAERKKEREKTGNNLKRTYSLLFEHRAYVAEKWAT